MSTFCHKSVAIEMLVFIEVKGDECNRKGTLKNLI